MTLFGGNGGGNESPKGDKRTGHPPAVCHRIRRTNQTLTHFYILTLFHTLFLSFFPSFLSHFLSASHSLTPFTLLLARNTTP